MAEKSYSRRDEQPLSMQKKLLRERAAGIKHGTNTSWDLFEKALDQTPGIGPKRKAAVIKTAIRLAQEKVGNSKDEETLRKWAEKASGD